MRILHLRFRNLNSLQGDWVLDFENGPLATSGLFAITGDTGAGKSTILDAITLALYGKTPRNHDGEVMTHGASECMAELEFEGLGGRYRAHWTQALKGRKTLKIKTERRLDVHTDEGWDVMESGTANLKSTTKRKGSIEAVTGLNFEQFCKSVLLPQGAFAAFLEAKEAERAGILERLTDSEIYSKISIAAFARHKAEKHELDKLNVRLGEHNLPSAEELEALKKEFSALKKEATKKRTALDALRENVASLEKIAKLKNNIQVFQTDFEKNKAAQAAAQTAATRLQHYKAAAPYQAGLKLVENLRAEEAQLRHEIEGISREIEALQSTVSALKEEAQNASEAHFALENKRQELTERWNAMAILDQELIFEKEKIEDTTKRFEQNETEKQRLQKEIDALEQAKKTARQALDAIAVWEKENTGAEHLKTDLELLNARKATMRKLMSDEKDAKESIELLQKKLSEKEQELTALKNTFAEQHNSVKKVAQYIHIQVTKIGLSENPRETQRLLNEKIKKELARSRSLEALVQSTHSYPNRATEIEQTLENTFRAEASLKKQIYARFSTLEVLHKEVETRKALHLQQVSYVNYERDRAQLKAGDACPLCGSLEHPFTAHNPTYVDTTKADFEQATSTFEQGKTAQNVFLQELLSKSQSTVEALESDKSLLEDLLDKKGDLDKKELEAQQKTQILDSELLDLKNKHKLRLEQRTTCTENLQAEQAKTSSILSKYGLHFDTNTFKSVLERLSKNQTLYAENQAKKTELTQTLAAIEGEEKNLHIQLKKSEETHAKIQGELNKAKQFFEEKKALRIKEYGTHKAEKEQTLFAQKIDNTKETAEQAKAKLQKETQNLTALGSTYKEKEKRQAKLSEQWTTEHAVLLKKLSTSVFSSLEAVKAALLSEEEAQDLEQHLKHLEETEKRLNTQLEGAEKELKIETDKAQQYPILEDARRALKEQTHAFEALQKNIGATENQLETYKNTQAQHSTLRTEIEGQKREEQRWGLLNSIIGAADGKRFRIFAQSLTLEQLISLANQHLQNLNSRYFIRKKQGESLDLEILDTYQADNIRSMNTLSGGEKFLTSLALALGLSDLAGKKTNIKSLFIDEGFGALDESALDMAISALENLQSTGVTIGIVSHIRGLKDRIETQVRVQKKGNGISMLEIF